MNNKKILERINRWQNINTVHSLACGYNSDHQDLIAVIIDKKPMLTCKDCDYEQDIPDMFLQKEIDDFMEQQEWLDKILNKI